MTGASAGVGRAVIRRFARDGARIGLLARGRDGLEAARRDVEAASARTTSRSRPVSLKIGIVPTISGIPLTANTAIVAHMARSTSGRFLAAVLWAPPPIER